MQNQDTILCKQCGKEIKLEPGMTKGFCLHCGTQFQRADQSSETDKNYAKTLYEKGAWHELLPYVEGEKADATMVAYKGISRIYVFVQDYIEDVVALAEKTRPRTAVQFFTFKAAFANDELHKAFYDKLERSIEALRKLFSDARVPDDLKAQASEGIVIELLREKEEQKHPAYWTLIACEHRAIPLIPFVPLERLQYIYAEYDRINPKNRILPNQMQVRNALRDAIVEKGGIVPKRGLFHKKKQADERERDRDTE